MPRWIDQFVPVPQQRYIQDAQRKLETASDLVEQAQEMRSLREECMLLQSADRQHVREIEKLKKIAQRASIQQEEIDQLKHQLEASHRHCQELLKLNVCVTTSCNCFKSLIYLRPSMNTVKKKMNSGRPC